MAAESQDLRDQVQALVRRCSAGEISSAKLLELLSDSAAKPDSNMRKAHQEPARSVVTNQKSIASGTSRGHTPRMTRRNSAQEVPSVRDISPNIPRRNSVSGTHSVPIVRNLSSEFDAEQRPQMSTTGSRGGYWADPCWWGTPFERATHEDPPEPVLTAPDDAGYEFSRPFAASARQWNELKNPKMKHTRRQHKENSVQRPAAPQTSNKYQHYPASHAGTSNITRDDNEDERRTHPKGMGRSLSSCGLSQTPSTTTTGPTGVPSIPRAKTPPPCLESAVMRHKGMSSPQDLRPSGTPPRSRAKTPPPSSEAAMMDLDPMMPLNSRQIGTPPRLRTKTPPPVVSPIEATIQRQAPPTRADLEEEPSLTHFQKPSRQSSGADEKPDLEAFLRRQEELELLRRQNIKALEAKAASSHSPRLCPKSRRLAARRNLANVARAMSKKNNELIESSQKDDIPERNVIREEQDLLNETESNVPLKPSLLHREDRPLGSSTPLEDRMLYLQKHLEVCKQSLDASGVPDLNPGMGSNFCETDGAAAERAFHETDRAAAVVSSLTNTEGNPGSAWTPSCLSNGIIRCDEDRDEQLYDSSAPWSCRAVIKELPSPIRRTTEAFRLAHGLAV
eukprot:gnl/MRDRNA2_/MRDRNA2_107857_c0_seq1.p1 gnl/MRDRNA2_/MRDRNA2_107857_c0~~gnl/MRDRNA2_/MRDRNA2_107857_c0_seq1.p1  ORF type:complete len:643 (+),score=113.31 gnl/MRDRNA2_/MRDRNA2_107857_c0_seq1:74-1930(+)